MWVLEACFEDEKVPFRKYLKPGGEYHFGRKAPADLILADKTVSKESATINVGGYKPGEEHQAPTLTVHALKRAIRIIDAAHELEWEQNRESFIGENVEPNGRKLLQAGDIVVLTRSAPSVKVLWIPMFFGYSTKLAKEPIEQLKPECNLFGIGMERSKHFLPQTTHFVLPTSSNLTAPLMQALMAAAHLVTLDYVDQVLRLAKLDAEDANSLEKHFRLPDEEGYFPDGIEIEGMIKPQVARALAANERRKTMFVGTTFLFIHGDNGMSKSLETAMQLCKAGRGRVVVESAARIKDDEMVLRLLRRNLSEAQSLLADCGEAASEAPDEGLVVICDNEDIGTDWYGKLIHLTRLLKIAMPEQGQVAVSKAILHADPRQYLNQMAVASADEQWPQSTNAETLPPTAPVQQMPATLPAATPAMDLDAQETLRPSAMARDPSPTLTTVTSTSADTMSAAASGTQKSPRKPRRRADMAQRDPYNDLFGTSAPSSVTAAEVNAASTTELEEPQSTSTARQTARPRRHDGTDIKRPRVSETWRSIFEPDSNGTPGNMDQDDVSSTYEEASQSKTRRFRMELDEADRLATQRSSTSQTNGAESQDTSAAEDRAEGATRKRRAQSPVVDGSLPARQRLRQSEEMEQKNEASEPKEPSPIATAPPTTSLADTAVQADKNGSHPDKTGNSDTDAKFLQAMASSKRSKKGMDQFDKEFNQLRLAKPAYKSGHRGKIIADADDPEYRAWEQMGASDFDINAAGNFVQVDFVPLIYHRSEEEEQERARRRSEMQEKWNGQPNHKKFRAKSRPQRKPLAMDVDEGIGMDYGLGDGYVRAPKASVTVMRETAIVSDDDEEEREVELMGPPPKPGPSRTKKSYHEDPFSDDESIAPSRRSTQSQSTTTTQRTQQRKRATSPGVERQSVSSLTKRGAVELSSDEDEEAGGFSGFRKRRRG